jgi:hypothetical protein
MRKSLPDSSDNDEKIKQDLSLILSLPHAGLNRDGAFFIFTSIFI